MKLFDYECVTTFWEDFSIADRFGADAIRDTYNRAFTEWKSNFIYLTELVMVLNHKLWYWYEKGNQEYAELYNIFWDETAQYAERNLKDEQLRYYFRITD